jgi:hypothetical protein
MVYDQFKERPNSLNNLKRYLVSRRIVPGLNLVYAGNTFLILL